MRCQQSPAEEANYVAVNTALVNFVDDKVSVGVEELRVIRKKSNAISCGYKPRSRLHPLVFSHSMAHPEGNFLSEVGLAVANTLSETFGCDPTRLSDEHFHFGCLGRRFRRL